MDDYSGARKVFAHAVALEQGGKMKSAIACKGNIVYILNFDKTILLRFELSRGRFDSEVCFNADDYDSDEFREENGKIVFVTRGEGGYDREKICKSPGITFDHLNEMFNTFWDAADEISGMVKFNANDLKLLDENLSHVEFLSEELKPVILQRDIFAGSIIKLERKKFSGLMDSEDDIADDFGPVGMRTNDLFALFAFNPTVTMYFLPPTSGYFMVEGTEYGMKAVVAKCLYDDLGTIDVLSKEDDNGREKQESGHPEQEADRNVDQGQEPERLVRRRRVSQE